MKPYPHGPPAGIFETFLIRTGRPTPLLEDHVARLTAGARKCFLKWEESDFWPDFLPILQSLESQKKSCRVRYQLNREAHQGVRSSWHITAHPPATDPEDWVLAPCKKVFLDPSSPWAGIKHIHREVYDNALREAVRVSANEPLLFTRKGDVVEGARTSLILYKPEGVFVPSLKHGILPGVTRGGVLDACKQAEIPVFEQRITMKDLVESVEVFVTNSVYGITPVREILEIRRNLPGRHGPFGHTLRTLFERYQAERAKSLLATLAELRSNRVSTTSPSLED